MAPRQRAETNSDNPNLLLESQHADSSHFGLPLVADPELHGPNDSWRRAARRQHRLSLAGGLLRGRTILFADRY